MKICQCLIFKIQFILFCVVCFTYCQRFAATRSWRFRSTKLSATTKSRKAGHKASPACRQAGLITELPISCRCCYAFALLSVRYLSVQCLCVSAVGKASSFAIFGLCVGLCESKCACSKRWLNIFLSPSIL